MKTLSEYDFTKIPFDRIVKFGQRSMLDKNTFAVSWILGRFCNYNCSYCWPYAHSRIKDYRPYDTITKTIDEIKRQAKLNGFDRFHFSFSGGEPTFHPQYLEILQYLNSSDPTTVHMTSNCSQPIKWFEKYASIASSFDNAHVTASFHGEYINTSTKVEQFADKLRFLIEHNVNTTINMVMVPERFEELYKTALYFHSRDINVTLKPQSDEKAQKVVEGYTLDMLDRLHNGFPQRDYRTGLWAEQSFYIEMFDDLGNPWYIDQAERFNAFNFNQFKGWKCNAGFQSIIIREPDGNIKRGYSCSDEPLGNIETGFFLFSSPVSCISKSCVSSADSKIPKVKNA
jgi:organic radical activating enzyme